jgi:hypothetical protein
MFVAPGLAEDLDTMAVLGEAVDECNNTGGAREGGASLLEGQIRRNDCGALLVAAADDVVENVGSA